MLALAATWDVLTDFAGSERSVAFLALVFLAAFADCTSSVLFWNFAGGFPEVYMSALGTGQGMSGVVTTLITWIQCVACDEPAFSATAYFIILAQLVFLSAVAYSLLLRRQHRYTPDISPAATVEEDLKGVQRWWLLGLQAWASVLVNGSTMSCLPLAAKPYGRLAYQWAQNSSMLIDPIAAALGQHVPLRTSGLLLLAVIMTLLHGYIFALSLEATSPPFLLGCGSTVLVLVAAAARALSAYTKVRINVLFHAAGSSSAQLLDQDEPIVAKRQLMWSGVAMQVGSCVGSVTVFALINLTSWFRMS